MSENGSLLIERLGDNDGGKYFCNASNRFGFARVVVTLEVLSNPGTFSTQYIRPV